MGVREIFEGSPTCSQGLQVTSEVGNNRTVRQSQNNAWYVNTSNGNVNNNNTINRNYVAGSSESDISDEWEMAERSFFRNKHGSVDAQRLILHPGRILRIARDVEAGTYTPKPGYAFPILEPSARAIFASFAEGRLVHHYMAPFLNSVAEAVHHANGDVSHGNRLGHSAHTGAEQIRDAMRPMRAEYPEPYVFKVDIYSFFASVPREKAFEILETYAREYYTGEDLQAKLELCRKVILHDHIKDCIFLSTPQEWARIPERKHHKNCKPGCSLPIGNWYSQILANLFLSVLDARLRHYGVCPRFVDDTAGVVKDKATALAAIREAEKAVEEVGLRLHPDKRYIQPLRHGVNFCGRTIKGERIYLSNRTINRAFASIRSAEGSLAGARAVCRSVNSYLGQMRHCTERKNERKLADAVLEKFSRWLYFVIEDGHFTCRMKKAYNPRNITIHLLNSLINKDYETCKDNRQ